MKSILDKAFRYTPAASTDLRITFARIRREQKRQEQDRDTKVKPLVRAKVAGK